jgi:lysozyme family protein
MDELFERAFDLVVRHEGGYVNNLADPGGETKYGISRRSYPNEDIKGMTVDRAKDIYYCDFWLPLQIGDLPDKISLVLFDMAVNMGRTKAIERLQEAVSVKVDGFLGPVTRTALKAKYGPELVAEIAVRRIMYYSSLDTFPTFGLGWVRRSVAMVRV